MPAYELHAGVIRPKNPTDGIGWQEPISKNGLVAKPFKV